MILLSELKAIWQAISDWVTGADTVSSPKVTVESSAIPEGAATEAKQDDAKAVLDTIDTSLDTLKAVDFATSGKQDTINTNITAVNTALGAKADTAATTDTGTFSLIALIKRGLASMSSVIKTAGSAIGTVGVLMFGSDGTNARAIKTNAAGEVLTIVTGSIVKQTSYGNITVAPSETLTVFQVDFGTDIKTEEWWLSAYIGSVTYTDVDLKIAYSTTSNTYSTTTSAWDKNYTDSDYDKAASTVGGLLFAGKSECKPLQRYMRFQMLNQNVSNSLTVRNVTLNEKQPKGVS